MVQVDFKDTEINILRLMRLSVEGDLAILAKSAGVEARRSLIFLKFSSYDDFGRWGYCGAAGEIHATGGYQSEAGR